MIILLKSIAGIESEIKNLRDLVIEYHYASQGVSLKDYLPSIIAALAILAGLFGPRFVFKLQERKEKKKDISKLYAEFSHNSKEFAINLVKFNRIHLLATINSTHATLLDNKLAEHRKGGGIPPNVFVEEQAIKSALAEKFGSMLPEEDRIAKDFRFKAIKALFEIQYLTGDPALDQLIERFEQVGIIHLDPKVKLTKKELEDDGFIERIMQEKVIPTRLGLDKLIKEIQAHLKAINI